MKERKYFSAQVNIGKVDTRQLTQNKNNKNNNNNNNKKTGKKVC